MVTRLSRRSILGGLSGAAVASVLAACGAPAAAPTVAPKPAPPQAAPTTAAAPTSVPAAKAAAPTPAPAAPTVLQELVAESGWMAPSQADYSDVTMALNDRLKSVGMELKVTPVADYANKVPLMFAAGEQFDFMFDAPFLQMTSNIINGNLASIEDKITDFPKLSAAFDETMRRANVLKGHLYGLPTYGFYHYEAYGIITREDLRKKHDLPVPTSYDETEALLTQVKKVMPDVVPSSWFFRGWKGFRIHAQNVGDTSDAGAIVNCDKGLTVVNVFESPEVRADYTQRRRMLDNGLLPRDIADKGYDRWRFFENGKAFAVMDDQGRYSPSYTQALQANGIADADALYHDLSFTNLNGFRWMTDLRQTNFQVFNAKGKVHDSLRFFEWILSDQDNIDLWTLGVKGKQWTDAGKGLYEAPKGVDPSGVYHRWWYLSGIPLKFHRLPAGLPDSDTKNLKHLTDWDDTRYIKSPLLGFAFDPEPLQSALAKNKSVISDKGSLLKNAQVANVDQGFKDLNEALKAAALDEELSKKQAQVDAFVKANKAQVDAFFAAIKS